MLDTTAAEAQGLGVEPEVPFGFDEIFFSRTDARGVIQVGNHVFQRVSGYGWERMIGAPHKLVRHPSMPKAVFHLLWERIKAGLATGAYVKNRSEDGRSYWVFAVIVPIADGYLSVRIKPGTGLFHTVKAVYADILGLEEGGLAPAESARELLSRLAAAGFPTYDAFQARALAAEVLHRAEAARRPIPPIAEAIATAEAADGIEDELAGMRAMFDAAHLISLNLRVLASKLGERGRPVGAISTNYSILASDMAGWLNTRAAAAAGGFATIARSVAEGLFLSNAAAILSEMADDFARSDETQGCADPAAESARLKAVCADYRQRSRACLDRLVGQAETMEDRLAEMRQHVAGLNSIRMLCRIEGAALRGSASSLDEVVAQLDAFQDELGRRLGRILALGQRIRSAAATL